MAFYLDGACLDASYLQRDSNTAIQSMRLNQALNATVVRWAAPRNGVT